MRRLYLKFLLWRSGYCTIHVRRKVFTLSPGGGFSYCPQCRGESYEQWKERLRLMTTEYEELNAAR